MLRDSCKVFYDATHIVMELIGVKTPRNTQLLYENHLVNT